MIAGPLTETPKSNDAAGCCPGRVGDRSQLLTVATAGLQSRYNAQWTLVMAATTVAIVPLILLFIALGRHIVRSIVVTGLK